MPSNSSINLNKQANLTRRLLFPQLQQDEPLPPLLISNNQQLTKLDAELYDIVALSLRAFVLPWWSKVSKQDKEFCGQICRVITHVIRELQRRLSKTDLLLFLLHDITTIFTQHYIDYRIAAAKTSTSYASGGALTFSETFHALQSHMAITPDGLVDEAYLRLAVEQVLNICLPIEDKTSETERAIIREITVNILQENLFGRTAQPWFWMRLLLNELGHPRSDGIDLVGASGIRALISLQNLQNVPRWEKKYDFHAFVVIVLSMVQSLSTAALAFVAFISSFYHILMEKHARVQESARQTMSIRPVVELASQTMTLRERHTSSAILSTLEGLEAVSAPLLRK